MFRCIIFVSFRAAAELPHPDGDSSEESNHTWDLKYVSCGVDSTSADAISRWRRIWRKEGLFRGLQFLQIKQEGTLTTHCQIHKVLETEANAFLVVTTLSCLFSASLVLPYYFFQTSLTSTAWGGPWSRRGSSPGWAAGGCCFPHPRWWQTSPRLCKGPLQLASPTAPLQRTLKGSQAVFLQEVSLWLRPL